MTHAEFTPHAAITLSNNGGIEIMVNQSGDGVFYRFNYGQYDIESEVIFEAEIDYWMADSEDDSSTDNAAFFTHGDGDNACRYFLNEAMRIS